MTGVPKSHSALRRPLFQQCEWRLCLSAVGFASHDIRCCELLEPDSVVAADLDGDGDLDVLVAFRLGNKFAWYENMDGQGTFGEEHLIDTEEGTLGFVSGAAVDMDGDGDLDVLATIFLQQRIAWYENENGKGDFGAEQVIATRTGGVLSAAPADVDGDGDVDVLAASLDRIAWYENTDGQGGFGPQKLISTEVSSARSVAAADVDGDGDPDALATSFDDGRIAWYENTDGQGSFGPQRVITTQSFGAWSVAAADVDGDGDQDALSAAFETIAWYENTDGQGSFGPQRVITQVRGGQSVVTADLDSDGDLDVLSASSSTFPAFEDTIAWYENTDGQGSFGPQRVITTAQIRGARSVFAADVDSDGDLDVLSTAYLEQRVAWHEQRVLADVNDDGVFDSSDLVQVFQAGEYEDRFVLNSTFDKGDWNGDREFDTSDLVLAFQVGHYESAAGQAASDWAAAIDLLMAEADEDAKRAWALLARFRTQM